jgi:twitching motility protein PilT
MQTGQGKTGMQTMNQCLYSLYTQGLISVEDALGRSPEPAEMKLMLESPSTQQGGRGYGGNR